MNATLSSSLYPAGSAAPLVSQQLYAHPLQHSLENAKTQTGQSKQAFQDFAAGLFFSQMLKSLRSGQNKPAYFHGGQAEEMFQSQMDQYITESLAHDHGKAFTEPLFERYQLRTNTTPKLKSPVETANPANESSELSSHINLSA